MKTQESPKVVITNSQEFAASNPQAIVSNNFAYDLVDILRDNKNHEVAAVIVADGRVAGAYKALSDAMSRRVNISLNGKEYTYIDYKSSFERDLILVDAVTCQDEYDMFSQSAYSTALFNAPKRMSESDYLNAFSAKGTRFSRIFAQNLNVIFTNRRNTVKDAISIDRAITSREFNIDVVDACYSNGETEAFIANNAGIHILAGEKGSGKTQVMKPLFDSECNNGSNPIFVNSSRVLSSSVMSNDDDRFYSNAMANISQSSPKGLFGVVNTVLLSNSFSTLRSKCRTFIVDEIEEVLNHQSGSAIGSGKVSERADINKEFDKMVKCARTVVLADAAFSMNSLKRIAKLANGKKIYYHPQQSSFKKPVIKVISEKQSVFEARDALVNGEKVAVFCDGSHNSRKSKFNQLFESITSQTESNTLMIDGAFMRENEASNAIADIQSLTSKSSAVFYNSAAKCGLSVVDADYKKMFAFSNKTVTPSELIQSFARFRNVEEVNLCMSDKVVSGLQVNPEAIAFKLMIEEYRASDVSFEGCTKMLADENKMSVIDRISFINGTRLSYDSNVLVMLELMGYEIQYVSKDSDKEEDGRKFINEGESKEKASREAGIANANDIDYRTYEQMIKDGEDSTQAGKNMCEKFALGSFYQQDVTESLVEFDKSGATRTFVRNAEMARKVMTNVSKGVETFFVNGAEKVKAHMYVMFFETTGLSPYSFGQYKASDADKFIDHVFNATIIINDNTSIPAKKAFEIAFPEAKLSKRSMSVVSSILKKEFGIKNITNTKKREDGQFVYEATPEADIENVITRRDNVVSEAEFQPVFDAYFKAKQDAKKSPIQRAIESDTAEINDFDWKF